MLLSTACLFNCLLSTCSTRLLSVFSFEIQLPPLQRGPDALPPEQLRIYDAEKVMIERMTVAAVEARARYREGSREGSRMVIRHRLSEEEHARRVSEARLPGIPPPPVGWTPSNLLPTLQPRTGRWEQDEHERFTRAFALYGRDAQLALIG